MQMKNDTVRALKKTGSDLLRLFLILLAALLINAIVLLASGKNPLFVYQKLLEGSLVGKWSIAKTVRWAISFLLCGISAAVAFRGDVLNLGIDGQLYVGAMAATVVGIYGGNLPGFILIPLCILASIVAGSLWSAFAGYLNVRFNASIVVITLMMNYIAKLLTEWITFYPLYTEEGSAAKATLKIAEQARLSILIPGTQVSTALFFAVVALVIVYIWTSKTSSGFEIKVMGQNARFASVMGIHTNRKKIELMLISGAFAGLCGGLEILGVHHRFAVNFSSGMGFDGMVVAMLANNNPLFLPFGALFMGAMRTGAASLEMFAKVPRAMASILMGVIVMFLTIQQVPQFWRRKKPKVEKKEP